MTEAQKHRVHVLILNVLDMHIDDNKQITWITQLGHKAQSNLISEGIAAALLYGFVKGAALRQVDMSDHVAAFERTLKQHGFGYLMSNNPAVSRFPKNIPFTKHYR